MSRVRGSTRTSADGPWDEPEEPLVPEVDLHGKRPDEALRHLGRELHSARHRRLREVIVITGQGLGNALHKPILRDDAVMRPPAHAAHQPEHGIVAPRVGGNRVGVEPLARDVEIAAGEDRGNLAQAHRDRAVHALEQE